jgi:Predicted nucleic acid-binding protein, contains PIN domain
VKLFVDTWGWLTLRDSSEARHKEVKEFYNNFKENDGTVYTSEYVLDETLTLLFRRLPFNLAAKFIKETDKAIKERYLLFEWIIEGRLEKAKELRLKFRDKPLISFTDLTSMVVMNELGITDILTEDDHFLKIGMDFRKVP